MKSFKHFAETVERRRSEDENAFIDKHQVDKKDHPVAKDDQFVAKTKKDKSKAASYKDGEDKAVYEESEQDEEPLSEEEKMSKAQMKKREEIVKSMKKDKAGFKDRYGDKADDVMYATATKMAMKSEETQLDEADDTHKTKDGRTAKKGLYYYINKKKKEGRKANPPGHEDRPTEDDFKAAEKTAKEEVEYVSESVIDDLRKIVKTQSAMPVKFANGGKTKVDMFTASAMVKVHDALKAGNQKKFADSINKDESSFMKMMDFAMKAVK